jgi:hypothetical protein
MTRPAQKHFAAKARIPLPVPRSTSDQPQCQRRVSCSKKRSDIAVVACSPVPNANEAGIASPALRWPALKGAFLSASGLARRWELRCGQRLQCCSSLRDLTIIKRFPILSGFESPRANRFSQLRGNGSMRPPNSLISAVESLRERQTISSSRRLRPGLRTITSWPLACFWRTSSYALTQFSSAVLRHRYTGKRSASQGGCASRSLNRLGAPTSPRLPRTHSGLQPSICATLQAKVGAGDEARTRDVHLGKVVLYQLSYTRSFERDNNVQSTAPRNLLIAFGSSKSLNPNGAFSASYDQTPYE